MLQENKIYHWDCVELMKEIDKETIDLVIADPPYFKVIWEKWDYVWRTEKEYLDWSLKWIAEVAHVLRYGGSFYLFWYFRNLALIVPYLQDFWLELRQQIIIDKGMQAVSWRATKNYKLFPNVTESILFIVKDNKKIIKPILKNRQLELWLSSKEINERLWVKSNWWGMWSIYTWKNICEQFPTKDSWNKLMKALDFTIAYEKLAQTYNPEMWITDVWRDINFYEEKRFHPTQKPIKLITRLISASSNSGDLILDPFMWAWSTAIASIKNNRKFIWFELDEDYYKICNERLERL